MSIDFLIVRPPLDRASRNVETTFFKTIQFHIDPKRVLGSPPGEFH